MKHKDAVEDAIFWLLMAVCGLNEKKLSKAKRNVCKNNAADAAIAIIMDNSKISPDHERESDREARQTKALGMAFAAARLVPSELRASLVNLRDISMAFQHVIRMVTFASPTTKDIVATLVSWLPQCFCAVTVGLNQLNSDKKRRREAANNFAESLMSDI